MLGSAVYGVLNKKYDLVLGIRNAEKADLLKKRFGEADRVKIVPFDAAHIYQEHAAKKGFPSEFVAQFLRQVGDVDRVINAVGVTIPFALRDPAMTFFVNGALPHILAERFGEKLIHITTDCVYNGKDSFPYDENSRKSPTDLYGLSKSMGEPASCLTIRTSIIGRELDGYTGLLEWFLQQRGRTITGFAEHYWNGITTQQFGKHDRRCDNDRLQVVNSVFVFACAKQIDEDRCVQERRGHSSTPSNECLPLLSSRIFLNSWVATTMARAS